MGSTSETKWIAAAAARLARGGIHQPLREARLIHRTPGLFADMIARRAGREPYSRIVGKREFWSLEFTISKTVFDPRPDSEILVEAAVERARHKPVRRALDLGCGSGCLLIALLHELPRASGIATDIQPAALAIAAANAKRHRMGERVGLVACDWGEALRQKFDIILCNPPYIASAELPRLMPEVKNFDPFSALDGGDDGQSAYRRILPKLNGLLGEDGVCFMELGEGWRQTLRLAAANKLVIRAVHEDYGGRRRCLVLQNGLS